MNHEEFSTLTPFFYFIFGKQKKQQKEGRIKTREMNEPFFRVSVFYPKYVLA